VRLRELRQGAHDGGRSGRRSVGEVVKEELDAAILIDDEIIRAYTWLIENFDDGGEIFIFGFSRGAYTARSLSGLITKCGILKVGRRYRSSSYTTDTAYTTRRRSGRCSRRRCLRTQSSRTNG
jgi:uncharacterized protein (DUF2235 family)